MSSGHVARSAVLRCGAHTAQSSGVQWCAVVCSGVQWCAVGCSGVQWGAVVCSGVQWGARDVTGRAGRK
jgi:hypothetical protein